jgi:hypothetical protein
MNSNYARSKSIDMISASDNLREAFITKRIYHGDRIFVVDQFTLAKHGSEDRNMDYLVQEYDIGKRLFNAGINVPKFHNLTWLSPELGEPDYRLVHGKNGATLTLVPDFDIHYDGNWFLMMQKIHGDEFTFLKGNTRKVAKKLLKQELNNVLDLGICPNKDALYCGNSIYNHDENKIYLIDFEGWRDGAKWEIDCFREILKGTIYMTGLTSRKAYFLLHPHRK